MVHAFLCTLRPRSVQARTTDKYKDGLLAACKTYWPNPPMLVGPLYGVVYYFHRKPDVLDADNLSKPVWDALTGYMYYDDRVIQLRTAGVRDIREGIGVLDLTAMPENVARDFISQIGETDHLLYVELGTLKPSMFTFNLAAHHAS